MLVNGLLLAASAVLAGSVGGVDAVDPGLKCGDIVSLQSMSNDKFVMTAGELTHAAADKVGGTEMYKLICRDASDMEALYYGDTVYMRVVATGEYLDDGSGEGTHSGSAISVHPVPKESQLAKRNEFTLFKTGPASELNDRGRIFNGHELAIRNEFTMMWSVVRGTTTISTLNVGGSRRKLPGTAVFKINGFCPLVKGAMCASAGSCVDNRCQCDKFHAGPACSHTRHARFCHIVGSAHAKTFDGLWFNVRSAGEMVLYGNVDAEEKEAVVADMEVLKDGSEMIAAKAVVVRRGSDLVRITPDNKVFLNCKEDLTEAVKAIFEGGFRTDAGLLVSCLNKVRHEAEETGVRTLCSKWKVKSPSGLVVEAHSVAEGAMNVWVRVHEPLLGNARGLCGNLDGKAVTDFGQFGTKKGPHDTLDARQIAQWTLPTLQSFAACGKDSQLASVGVDPISQPDAVAATLTQVSVQIVQPTDEEENKALLQDAFGACVGEKSNGSAADARKACAQLDDKEDKDVYRDYINCVADFCASGDAAFATASAEDAKKGDKQAPEEK